MLVKFWKLNLSGLMSMLKLTAKQSLTLRINQSMTLVIIVNIIFNHYLYFFYYRLFYVKLLYDFTWHYKNDFLIIEIVIFSTIK